MFEIDFRNYADLIRKAVKEANDRDPNWEWSIRSLTKCKVLIRWGYLDYLEEKHPHNCFSLTIDYPNDEHLWNAITYRHPSGEMLSFNTFGKDHWETHATVELAIEGAIRNIEGYAHSRY